MRNDESSVEAWFPELFANPGWLSSWKDQRYEVPCYNPMAAGIRCADRVNTVSPSYAEEILEPNNPPSGFHGGEGLEQLLREAWNGRRLHGILNGIEYPEQETPKMSMRDLCTLVKNKLIQWNEKSQNELFNEVIHRINRLKNNIPPVILTSVTRIVEQKVQLLLVRGSDGIPALEHILNKLAEVNGVYFLLGNGTPDFERQLAGLSRRHERLLFVNGYSPSVAQALYANGTMFLMPSLFEPCGISQMLAMRESQPCIVHAVGGLKDTVADGVNGFSFEGGNLREKADGLVRAVDRALRIFSGDRKSWNGITGEAGRSRFTWDASAKEYIRELYCSQSPA